MGKQRAPLDLLRALHSAKALSPSVTVAPTPFSPFIQDYKRTHKNLPEPATMRWKNCPIFYSLSQKFSGTVSGTQIEKMVKNQEKVPQIVPELIYAFVTISRI